MPARLPSLAPLALLAGLAALAAAPSGARAAPVSPEIRALVKKCVAAYGGPAALDRMARILEEGTVTSQVLHPGPPGRIGRALERPGKLRVVIMYPEQEPEVRVLAGGRGWRFGEEVQGPFLTSMVLQAARIQLPALLAAAEAQLTDRGTWSHEGATLRVLALEIAPGVLVEAGIDPATGRILRSRGTATGAMPLEFVTTSSDFRTVDGVLVAFREGNWANGRSTGETVLTRVVFPPSITEEAFTP